MVHPYRHLTITMDYYTAFFSLVGFLAVANWMYTTFESLVWITYYNILEQLNPEKYSLEKRFGQWAGKIRFHNHTNPLCIGINQLKYNIALVIKFLKVFHQKNRFP